LTDSDVEIYKTVNTLAFSKVCFRSNCSEINFADCCTNEVEYAGTKKNIPHKVCKPFEKMSTFIGLIKNVR